MEERKLFGILAHPVGHSLSPVMYQQAFIKLGLPYAYHPFDVPPERLAQAVSAIKVLGISGVNVTIPHKERIIPFLDRLDPEAEAIGAVNTVVLEKDGTLTGYNTDGAGYVESLKEETGLDLSQCKVLILGAGGAAKAIGVYLLKEGVPHLTIVNRTLERAHQLACHLEKYLKSRSSPLPAKITVRSQADLAQNKSFDYQLIINTTSVGMWPHVNEMPMELGPLPPSTVVSDIVYNPYETLFLKKAKEQGATIHRGLGMLVYQGTLAFKLFTGYEAPVDTMWEAVRNHLAGKAK